MDSSGGEAVLEEAGGGRCLPRGVREGEAEAVFDALLLRRPELPQQVEPLEPCPAGLEGPTQLPDRVCGHGRGALRHLDTGRLAPGDVLTEEVPRLHQSQASALRTRQQHAKGQHPCVPKQLPPVRLLRKLALLLPHRLVQLPHLRSQAHSLLRLLCHRPRDPLVAHTTQQRRHLLCLSASRRVHQALRRHFDTFLRDRLQDFILRRLSAKQSSLDTLVGTVAQGDGDRCVMVLDIRSVRDRAFGRTSCCCQLQVGVVPPTLLRRVVLVRGLVLVLPRGVRWGVVSWRPDRLRAGLGGDRGRNGLVIGPRRLHAGTAREVARHPGLVVVVVVVIIIQPRRARAAGRRVPVRGALLLLRVPSARIKGHTAVAVPPLSIRPLGRLLVPPLRGAGPGGVEGRTCRTSNGVD
eukprot:Hpha_TRINITY_DN16332_c2_g4::TRINITY_DN16332_c2_g4_i1::g.60876::m.60876